MKYLHTLFAATLLGMGATTLHAQETELAGHKHARSQEFRPNEILVKFKADSQVNVRRKANGQFATTSVSNLDRVLRDLGTTVAEPLMPLMGSHVSPKKMKSYTGTPVQDVDLSQLYCLRFDADKETDILKAIELLQEMDEVEYAEPNYLVYTMDAEESTPDDPYYSQQGYLNSINVAPVWNKPNILGRRPVIAIIDTGVDISHPDLADNIWTNTLEAEGNESTDDDGNGFKDDIHGWDFVNQTGRIGDWNGHGTHCAGIAGAVGNNGVGIVGANPDALIMPITVMQSDGVGDVATIIKGVDYAVANGADVLSMSIGGYTHSVSYEQALGKAYAKAVIVAAAGNNCLPINPTTKCPYCGLYGSPSYPAAFTFVLGVQAADAIGSFSNYDDDGPVYTQFSSEKLYNYELKAPGVKILSTYPNGRYKQMNGTSMACPLVAGAVSKLLQTKEYLSKEILFGDLINTSGTYVNIEAAYNLSDADRHPTLSVLSYRLDDSEGDNDGRPDAGELIKLYPTIRNDWGQANNIKITVGMGENEDATLVEFVTAEADMGYNLSSYAKLEALNPVVIRLSDQIVDGRHLKLTFTVTCDNCDPNYKAQNFTLNVENGVELGGTQKESITLQPGIHYIVTRNWGIPKDVTVTAMPGTTIKIKDGVGISNYGHMLFTGTAEAPITITKGDNDYGQIGGFLNDNANYTDFTYCIFDYLKGITFDHHTYENCIIRNCTINTSDYLSSGGTFRNCDIYNNQIPGVYQGYLSSGATFIGTNVHNNEFTKSYGGFGSAARFWKSNYIGNTITKGVSTPSVGILEESNCYGNFYDVLDGFYSHIYYTTEPEIAYLSKCFVGTANKDVAYAAILDEVDNYGWGHVDAWQISDYAYEEAPGCVDFVEVDGVNTLDDPENAIPLGVGKHLVEVGFNRAMNQKVDPVISMGVRPPYTQKPIAEDGFWYDPYTYRAYITIDGKSATDGLNRIRIYGYQQKENDWELPEEHYRYNVNVQAAGSMSTGMQAIAGLGKVELNWETKDEDFNDLMGYNVYRFTRNEEGIASDSILVNDTMVEPGEIDEYDVMTQTFTDYNVVPGTTYYYFIKEIGTDLTQNSISNVVAATPLTAQKGDSNGSLTVDVADILADINYIMGENPQPFIFEAADVNEDKDVNIIDVIATADLIMAPESASNARIESTVTYTVEDGILYLDSPIALGGIQLALNGKKDVSEFTALETLNGLEQLSCWQNDNRWLFLSFSMSGDNIAAGYQPILKIGDAEIDELILSDTAGRNVVAINGTTTSIGEIADLPYGFDRNDNVNVRFYDLSGREINRNAMSSGVYVVGIYVDGQLVKSYKMLQQ